MVSIVRRSRALAALIITFLIAAVIVMIPSAAEAAAPTFHKVRALDANGNRLPGVTVRIEPYPGDGASYTGVTDEDGELTLTTIDGWDPDVPAYRVSFDYDGEFVEYYEDTVNPGEARWIDIVPNQGTFWAWLDVLPPVHVSGSVYDGLTWEPIEHASVDVSVFPGSPYAIEPTSAETDENGEYRMRIDGLFPAQAAVRFHVDGTSAAAPYGYADQYWPGAADADHAEPVDLAEGAQVSGIGAALMPNGVVAGTVTRYDDGVPTPVAGATVQLTDADGVSRTARTDASGAYEAIVAPGTYTVAFGEDADGFQARQYYDHATTSDAATPVIVTAKERTAGIDAVYGIKPGTVTVPASPKIGEALTADPGTWSPADVTLAYQWYRVVGDTATAIADATAATHVPTADDLGARLRVVVTGSAEGQSSALAEATSAGATTDPAPGSIRIHIVDEAGDPIDDVPVLATRRGGDVELHGISGRLGGDPGEVRFDSAPRGTYDVQVFPPDGAGGVFEVVVEPSAQRDATFTVSRTGLPKGVDIQPSAPSWQGGVAIPHGEAFAFVVTGDPGAVSATWTLADETARTIRTGTLAESPAGTYTDTLSGITAPGRYTLTAVLTAAGGTTETFTVDIYIDPSGTVVDRYGTPVADATVELYTWEDIPVEDWRLAVGSEMSPANRVNPDRTAADGTFGWDVVPATYKLVATAGGASVQTGSMEVPPERLDLVLALPIGSQPEPLLAPAITGSAVVGDTLTATGGTWLSPAGEISPIAARAYQWQRNGVAIPGATASTYTANEQDAGAQLTVAVTVGRAHGVDAGDEPLLWTLTTAPVSVSAAVEPVPAGGSGATGTGVVAATGAPDLRGFAAMSALMLGLGVVIVARRRRARV
ncbi:carboxypeptidase regulatory-like domain-containing protein [Microbacterium sp. GXF7504]